MEKAINTAVTTEESKKINKFKKIKLSSTMRLTVNTVNNLYDG